MHYIIWLLISCGFFAVGEIASKMVANQFNHKWVIVACLASMCSTITWLPAIIQKNQLAVVGTMWSVLSLVVTVLLGLLMFGEYLSKEKVVGIVLALIAVYLLAK